MNDLAEHIGLILSITAGLLALVGAFIGMTWRDLKTSIRDLKTETEKFTVWLSEREKEGGLVTRDKFFSWCTTSKQNCPAMAAFAAMTEWRTDMLEKGGPLTRIEHANACDEITGRVMKRIDECFSIHKQWVADQLQIIQTTMDGKILKEIAEVKKEVSRH